MATAAGRENGAVGYWACAALIALGLASSPLGAQTYLVHTYDENDGLPSSVVHDLDQDPLGRVWFATRSGLAVYDGLSWIMAGAAEGLPAGQVLRVSADRWGGVWAMSLHPTPRVHRLDGGRWSSLPPLPGEALEPGEVTGFEAVEIADGPALAVGTRRDGLLLWNGNAWRRLGTADGFPEGGVRALAASGRVLYAATSRGVLRIVSGRVTGLATDDQPAPANVRALALEGPAGPGSERGASGAGEGLWVLGGDWVGRLDEGQVTVVGRDLPAAGRGDVSGPVLQPDRFGGVYYGSETALVYVDRFGRTERLGRGNGLAAEGASDLLLDREGNLWVASYRGASKLVSRRFASYDSRHGLLEDEVTAVAEARPGKLVFGHNRGLTVHEGRGFETLAFDLSEVEDPSEVRVLDLRPDGRGGLWVAASSLGLGRLDAAGRLTWYGGAQGIEPPVFSVAAGASGDLRAACGPAGVFEPAGAGLRRLGEGGPAGWARRLFTPPGGGLLVAASDGLFLLEELEERRWRRIEGPPAGPEADVFAHLVDSRGQVWVGTLGGLLRLEGGRLRRTAGEEPSTERPVYFAVEDAAGALWFGLDNGVLRWDGTRTTHYTVAEGLAGRETNRAAGFLDGTGRLWIGTESGVSRYEPVHDAPPGPPPTVLVERLGESGPPAPADGVPFAIPDNHLAFRPRVISLIDERAISIRYRLRGFDAAWGPPQPYRGGTVRYANLSPGRYRLEVQARNGNGPWSDAVASAEVVVASPFWNAWWFHALWITAAGTLVAALVHAGYQRRVSRFLEAEVATRTARLRESEERLRRLSDSAREGILLHEATSVADANEAAARMLGYRLPELIGKDGLELIAHQDRPLASRHVREGYEQPYEVRALRKDGSTFPVELVGREVLHQGRRARAVVFRDLTERRAAEAALRESEERYRALFEESLDAIFVTTPEGRIVDINPAGVALFGYDSKEEMLRVDASELYAEPAERRRHVDVLDRQGFVRELEVTLARRDGKRIVVSESTTVARDESGRVVAYRGHLRDITQQRELERQLQQAQKLKAVGELTAGVAHEFNNLLTVVLGNVEFLDDRLRDDEVALRLTREIERASRRGARLVEQLLAFSRRRPLSPRPVHLDLVVEEVWELIRRTAGERVSAEVRAGAGVGAVEVDVGALQSALLNLAVNARDAMPEGGRLLIAIGSAHLPAEEAARLEVPPGAYATLSVTDTGCGMSSDVVEQAFEPFFTTKEVGRGTGLGLSMVYGFVRQSGGTAEIHSQVGGGTTVRLYLPLEGQASRPS